MSRLKWIVLSTPLVCIVAWIAVWQITKWR
jgi:hypothetical protein